MKTPDECADTQALELLADEAEDVAAHLHDPGHATKLRLLARLVRAIHGGGSEATTVVLSPSLQLGPLPPPVLERVVPHCRRCAAVIDAPGVHPSIGTLVGVTCMRCGTANILVRRGPDAYGSVRGASILSLRGSP